MAAIQIRLSKTEDDLFCRSKWWGNPDIPADFDFDDQNTDFFSAILRIWVRCSAVMTHAEVTIYISGVKL